MTTVQKVIKYVALAFAIFWTVSIISGILSAVGLIGNVIDGEDAVMDEMKLYEVSENITSIDISINAADLVIREGEVFSVESNLKRLTVKERNGVLSVKESKSRGVSYNGAALVITLPKGTVLDKAEIESGAGRFSADRLAAKTVDLGLGAGAVEIDLLEASERSEIDGGAGKITVSDGSINALDLDMGVGQLELNVALTGNCDLDLGVGKTVLNLLGGRDDYSVRVEKGLGSVKIDGKDVSDGEVFGNGANRINVEGGVGSVDISYKE